MKIRVKFKNSWFFSGAHANSVSKLASLCSEEYKGEIVDQNNLLNEFEFELSGQHSSDEIRSTLSNMIVGNIIKDDNAPELFEIKIDEADHSSAGNRSADIPAKPTEIAEPSESVPNTQDNREGSTSISPLEKINSLTGADEFKQWCAVLDKLAPMVIRHKTEDIFFSNAYTFAIDPGCGHTTALKLLTDELADCGIFKEKRSPVELLMPDPDSGDSAEGREKISHTLTEIQRAYHNSSSRIVSIDISAWPGHTDTPEFKKMLNTIVDENEDNVTIFRTGLITDEEAKQLETDIGDLISVKTIRFKSFTTEQMQTIAREIIEKYNYTMADDAWAVFDLLIEDECKDGYFYGIRTIQKVAKTIIWQTLNYSVENDIDTSEITAEIISPLLNSLPEEVTGALSDLDNMIGMEKVASQVKLILQQIAYAREQNIGVPSMHMSFVGNPGTGKTTVARIIGSVLKQKGYLRIGKFYEYHGRDFVAKYVGWTADKTASICKRAYGSVLFIDEAYSLTYGSSNEDSKDFGKEVIDTLIAQMENHRDDMIVIFAGYPQDMEKMIAENAGMRDRVKYTIHFDNYTRPQLAEIFLQMSGKQFSYTDEYAEHARSFFDAITDDVLLSREFGNARFCRNLYEKAWGHAAARCPKIAPGELILEAEDFDAAAADTSVTGRSEKKIKIGF